LKDGGWGLGGVDTGKGNLGSGGGFSAHAPLGRPGRVWVSWRQDAANTVGGPFWAPVFWGGGLFVGGRGTGSFLVFSLLPPWGSIPPFGSVCKLFWNGRYGPAFYKREKKDKTNNGGGGGECQTGFLEPGRWGCKCWVGGGRFFTNKKNTNTWLAGGGPEIPIRMSTPRGDTHKTWVVSPKVCFFFSAPQNFPMGFFLQQ